MHVQRLHNIPNTSHALAILDHLLRCNTPQQADKFNEGFLQAWRAVTSGFKTCSAAVRAARLRRFRVHAPDESTGSAGGQVPSHGVTDGVPEVLLCWLGDDDIVEEAVGLLQSNRLQASMLSAWHLALLACLPSRDAVQLVRCYTAAVSERPEEGGMLAFEELVTRAAGKSVAQLLEAVAAAEAAAVVAANKQQPSQPPPPLLPKVQQMQQQQQQEARGKRERSPSRGRSASPARQRQRVSSAGADVPEALQGWRGSELVGQALARLLRTHAQLGHLMNRWAGRALPGCLAAGMAAG